VKRRLLLAIAASIVLVIGLGMTTIPAKAQPTFQICNDRGAQSLCLNRLGGGTRPGTSIIGWSAGDNNNGFAFISLSGMCNHGRVSSFLQCPFTPNRGLNDRYDGASIVAIQWTKPGSGLCVADSGIGSGSAILDRCPDIYGNGGANGTIFTLSQSGNPTYVVNRYWSNNIGGGNGYNPRWMCVYLKAAPVFLNSNAGLAGYCQFNEI
jgi:hypothetical protein